ncbi:hypothetical protein JN535_10780 [Cellulosimicrobium cellulans]|uniref:hypothetical protein n=1 Tax=Cellulosimicrobium cellulans TaxID=1710 RepID=UPI001965977D|nr:hypothetical protein [Cellulosimicrobium cellulans]MBN0040648.1 hypothetical protein [Cellulosimicrobium cellulans]
MGFLDRLLGREPRDPHGAPQAGPYGSQAQHPTQYPTQPAYGSAPQDARTGTAAPRTPDQVAIDRYRYLLRTAPPDQVEQAHAEAFARLTPEQRRQVLAELGEQVPASERATSDAPQDLARMATRAEMRQPGTLERTFAGRGQGAPGFGAMVGSSLLGTIAGIVIGSAVANALFGPAFADPTQPVAEDAAAEQGGEDPGAAEGGDGGAVEAAAEDPSGGGDLGGDFGGGFDDFGGFGEF